MLTWGMRTNARTAQSIDYHNWTEAFHTLPVVALDEVAGRHVRFWKDWVSHPDRDDYWRGLADAEPYAEIAAPAYLMGGWYDVFVNDTLRSFAGMRRHGRTEAARRSRLIVGPWAHALSSSTCVGDVDFGPQSLWDLDAEEQRWLDYWLKGEPNGIADEPPLKLFIMGAGEWRDEWEWPLTRHRVAHRLPRLGRRRQHAARRRPAGLRRAPGGGRRPVRVRPALPGADGGRQQLLFAGDRPLGAV